MNFLDRRDELARLRSLEGREAGGLAVLVGRRRIGKTRLLLEWARRADGLYVVADESAPEVQRAFVARALADRFPGFADVAYPGWEPLFARIADECLRSGWRGPLIFDELPYLAASSPELPSVLQRWIDHGARRARVVVAVAGSSQRMMQGLVLGSGAPLFGRAAEVLDLAPLDPCHLVEAFGALDGQGVAAAYTAWGGVPRYWELAQPLHGDVAARVDHLVLDPLGPLHREPERLLQEEAPPAMEVRPVLDAIGLGAHRVSEIAGRIGRPATSMARPLARLQGLGLVRRETPFGESERESRRALYRIDDPLVRLWFRVVAPHRAALTSGTRPDRLRILSRSWPGLLAEAWEDVVRLRIPRVREGPLADAGDWNTAQRWWQGDAPEWDVVCESRDGERLLFGEVKARTRPLTSDVLRRSAAELRTREEPRLPARFARHERIRALFVPARTPGVDVPSDVLLVTARDLGLTRR
jgi:hypothetical protein